MHRLLARFLLCLLAGFGLPAQAGESATGPAEPALLLANVYREDLDVSRYWVSEKLDGVRAYWDGRHLRFRGGQPVRAPAWFTAGFPDQALDGELWIDRRRFDRLSGIVRKQAPMDAEWREVRYMVFELPDAPGDFSARLSRLRELVHAAGVPWLRAVEQFRVEDAQALKHRLDAVLKGGGEGLMLHLAEAPYLSGRSDVLLKLKPWLDAEAMVVGHVPGQGKYTGMLGALLVEMPNGRRFRIGTGLTDALRRTPPAIGTRVTYRYRELNSNGLPRFASFLRVRDGF